MSLLDLAVDTNFKSQPIGRVVVFPGMYDRGYVVKSTTEELKIRCFLKMYYFAHFSVLLLGSLFTYTSSMTLAYALGRPAKHFVRDVAISFGISSLVLGFPYLSLRRLYKNSFLSFVSVEDAVVMPVEGTRQRQRFVIGGICVLVLVAVMLGIIFLPK
jgi:hypothetical protein